MQKRTKDSSQQHYLEMYAGLISELGPVLANWRSLEFFVNESTDRMCQGPRTQS